MAKGSRKLYVGILGLAGVALTVDRFFLGQPSNARASETTVAAADPVKAASPAVIAPARSAAARIAAFGAQPWAPERGDLGDVPDWLRPSPTQAAPQAKPAAVKPWSQRYKVTGYSRGARSGVTVSALETGRDVFVMIGDTFDGMTLSAVEVEEGVAVFKGPDAGVAPLKMPIMVLQRKLGSENAPAPR